MRGLVAGVRGQRLSTRLSKLNAPSSWPTPAHLANNGGELFAALFFLPMISNMV